MNGPLRHLDLQQPVVNVMHYVRLVEHPQRTFDLLVDTKQ